MTINIKYAVNCIKQCCKLYKTQQQYLYTIQHRSNTALTKANIVHLYDYTDRITPYSTWLQWQQQLIKQRFPAIRQYPDDATQQLPDLLILCQHNSVYTLGRAADESNVKFPSDTPPPNSELYKIDRGGDVTYHNTGQLVIYPILDLRRHTKSLHWYIRHLEQLVINVLSYIDIIGYTIPDLTGVWVGDKKVCAIGLNASRWITSHGAALNINIDLSGFEYIVPCGIADKGVTSITEIYNENDMNAEKITMNTVKHIVIREFEKLFHSQCILQHSDTPLDVR